MGNFFGKIDLILRKNNLSIFFGIFLVSMLFVPPSMSTTAAEDSEIPAWIKNNAGWWATDQIDDSSFLQGIQYLIKEGIMVIPPTETSESSGSDGIPTWIKNNAGWWAENKISEREFVNAITHLIKIGIINVQKQLTPQIEIEKFFEGKVSLIPMNERKTNYNSYGLRGSEFEETKPDNTFRIFAIGGSTTYGNGVEEEFAWPSQLQKKLDELNLEKDVEVINAGIGAASAFQNYKQIKDKLIFLEPDLFIMFEGANDHLCMIPEYYNKYTNLSKEVILDKCGEHPPEEHVLVMAERYSEFCELGKKIGFDVIVTIQPINEFEGKILTTHELEQIFAHPMRGVDIENYKILTKTILEKTSCSAVVNLTRIFDDYDLPIYADRVHTSNLGYEIIAENILDNVVPILVEKNILNEKPNNLEKIPKNKFQFGQDLKYSDFSGKDLENKSFFGADLKGSNFEGAILSYADFRLANLEDTNFANAEIDNIKLRQNNMKNADFTNVDFSKVNLTNVDLGNTILKNSNLSHKDLTKTFLYNADLSGVDLTESDLSFVYLKDVVLKNANLSGTMLFDAEISLATNTDLAGVILHDAMLTQSNLSSIDFSGKKLDWVSFYGSDLTGQDFTNNVIFSGVSFFETKLSNSNFDGVDLSAKEQPILTLKNAAYLINLSDVDLTKELFGEIAYRNIMILSKEVQGNDFAVKFASYNNFTHANLKNANFKDAELSGTYFYSADLTNADLSGADLSSSYLANADFSNADLSGANLDNAILDNAILTGANLKCINHSICE